MYFVPDLKKNVLKQNENRIKENAGICWSQCGGEMPKLSQLILKFYIHMGATVIYKVP